MVRRIVGYHGMVWILRLVRAIFWKQNRALVRQFIVCIIILKMLAMRFLKVTNSAYLHTVDSNMRDVDVKCKLKNQWKIVQLKAIKRFKQHWDADIVLSLTNSLICNLVFFRNYCLIYQTLFDFRSLKPPEQLVHSYFFLLKLCVR